MLCGNPQFISLSSISPLQLCHQHRVPTGGLPVTESSYSQSSPNASRSTTITTVHHSTYTHPQGYKLCLQVYANGQSSDENTHVLIFCSLILMRGENDDCLQLWPLEADIIIDLLNWREDKNHCHSGTISFNRHADPDGILSDQVTATEYAQYGWGLFPTLLSPTTPPPTLMSTYRRTACD